MNAEIRPRNIHFKNEGKTQVFDIDQFHWYADGLESGSVPPDVTQRSAVSFIFPHSKDLGKAELLVLGKSSELEAYFLSVNERRKNTIQRIFSYNGGEIDKRTLNLDTIPSHNVFTTQETPFLYRGEKTSEFSREYLFNLFGSEYFQVIVQRKEPAKFDYMELKYLPDSRDRKPFTIAKIVNNGMLWFLE